MTPPQSALSLNHVFGLSGPCLTNVHYLDEGVVLYAAASGAAIFRADTRDQEMIQGMSAGAGAGEGITCLAISPHRKLIAIGERGTTGKQEARSAKRESKEVRCAQREGEDGRCATREARTHPPTICSEVHSLALLTLRVPQASSTSTTRSPSAAARCSPSPTSAAKAFSPSASLMTPSYASFREARLTTLASCSGLRRRLR